MKTEAKSGVMKVIEMLREEAGVSKTEISKRLSSRTRYYEHLKADDIMFEKAKLYFDMLGYDLYARNRRSGFEKKL